MVANTARLTNSLRARFEAARDPERAAAMAAYMRDQFAFLGIPNPARVQLEKLALKGIPAFDEASLATTVRDLWALDEREYQYCAVAILSANAKLLTPAALPLVRELVTTKSWWDTVDALASHVVGTIVANYPSLASEMDAWVLDPNLWVVRTAILHQLRYKARTDSARLFSYCELQAGHPDFFIRKAIGWALREYSKTDADAVRAFVAAHEAQLSGLSRREALLWLNGGRKKKLA
ncbi:MAG: DNA alkylation repair protein [bacterium]